MPPTEPDWDSYGGLPTTPKAIAAAEQVALSMREGRFVAVPCSNGGVQIECFDDPRWEIEISPDGRQGWE